MKKNLRITHVIAGRCGKENTSGVYKSVYSFVTTQAYLGERVSLICVSNKKPEMIEGVEVIHVKPSSIPLLASSELERKLLETKADVIHLHSAYVPMNAAVGRLARRHKIPYVVTPHGNVSPSLLKRRPYLKYPYKYLFERPLLNRALFVHTISDSDDVIRYGVKNSMVTAVNGIDCPDEYMPYDGKPGIMKYGIPGDQTVLLFLGRLDIRQKGLDLLLKGFSKARALHYGMHLVLAGSDWDNGRSSLEKLVKDLNIGDAVTFTGAVYGEEKHALLRDCDFFAHTSRWEAGIPFSVLEALSYGKKVIVTNQVDRNGLLLKNELGIVVDENEESISQGFSILAKMTAEEIEQTRSDARSFLVKIFSWVNSTKDLIEGYVSNLNKLG